jgi:phosphoribosyl-ATP pyrophosphohydrolase
MSSAETLDRLAALIAARRSAVADASYTRQLLDAGAETCARKFGEEAIETVIAGIGSDAVAVKKEAADVLYHLLVLLECKGVPLSEVMTELEKRMGTSGIDEKKSRG